MVDKNNLRKETLAIRNGLSDAFKEQAERFICEKLTSSVLYKRSETVMSYMDFRNEVPTRLLNRYCLKDRKNLLFPYCIDHENMVAVRAEVLPDGTYTDILGISVPDQSLNRVVRSTSIDLVVVPGVVYNKQGYRIGYGKGFYDRFLTSVGPNCIKVGFAYEFQIIDVMFQSEYDIPVDILISEKSTYGYENSAIRL